MITDTGCPPVVRLLSDAAVLPRGGCPAHRRVRADHSLGPAGHRPREAPVAVLHAVLDLVEHEDWSLERACAHPPPPGRPPVTVLGERVPPVHDGVRRWVHHAARTHLAATAGRTPTPDFWVRQYMPERGARHRRPYEVRAAGRCYTRGAARELWVPEPGALRRAPADAGVAVAAYVLATGTPVDREAYAADPDRYHGGAPYPMRRRCGPPERVRVIRVSCLDGAAETRFDGTVADAEDLFASRGREGLRAALVGGARAPGADCLACGVRSGCGRLPRTPGLLGLGPAPQRLSWSPSVAREHSLCPARAHFRALGLPAVPHTPARRTLPATPRRPDAPAPPEARPALVGAPAGPAAPRSPGTPGHPDRPTAPPQAVSGTGTPRPPDAPVRPAGDAPPEETSAHRAATPAPATLRAPGPHAAYAPPAETAPVTGPFTPSTGPVPPRAPGRPAGDTSLPGTAPRNGTPSPAKTPAAPGRPDRDAHPTPAETGTAPAALPPTDTPEPGAAGRGAGGTDAPAREDRGRPAEAAVPAPGSAPARSGDGVVAGAVRAWLERAHERLPRRACEPADLPVDPARWACAGRRLFGERARRAAAMLAAHIPVCPLRDLPAGDHVRSGPSLTADDTDADMLVVYRTDVLHHRRGSWVHRSVLISEGEPPRATGAALLDEDPRAALGVLFFAAGVITSGPEPAVEIEVLTPGGARVEVLDPASPPVLAAAERTVHALAAPWHRDRAHTPVPGPACRTCPYRVWCPRGEDAAP
ncbi:hypothetical protein SUDANB121_05482 [Nocardiopsis dassonvillei]|uniref:hypothetical protein n=1 Tax=Nocardiopsis dassonvillei TaxID=2014 RepID=UPI003F54AC78